MFDHAAICGTSSDPANNLVELNLQSEMHCICGFSSANGNSLAKHLLTCHHSSVYPNFERAQENIVKKNMLDMLGLVRRDGETPEPSNETTQVMEDESPPVALKSIEEESYEQEQLSTLQNEEETKILYDSTHQIVEQQHSLGIPQAHPEDISNIHMNHEINQSSNIEHIPQPPVR